MVKCLRDIRVRQFSAKRGHTSRYYTRHNISLYTLRIGAKKSTLIYGNGTVLSLFAAA